MHNLHQLTGIRGLAAFIVVFYHIESYLAPYVNHITLTVIKHGYLAVDFFFILSGFVIAFNYFEKLSLPSKKIIYQFYIKRIARIYPLHLLVLLTYLSIPIAYLMTGKDLGETNKFSQESFLLSLFLMQAWGWVESLTWNIPSWSISTEMMAYLLFPLMVFILSRSGHRWGVKGAITAFVLALFIIIFIFSGTKNIGDNIQTLGILRCALEFFCGVCIWYITKNSVNIPYGKAMFYGGGVLFLLLVASNIPNYYYVPLTMSLIILGSVSCQSVVNDFFSHHIFIWLGNISYSVYLTHYIIRDWFKLLFLDSSQASILWIISYVVIVLLVSHILYKYYEIAAKNKVLKVFYTRGPGRTSILANEKL